MKLEDIIKDANDTWTEEKSTQRNKFYKKYGNIFQLENIDSLTREEFTTFWKDGYFHWGSGYSQNAAILTSEDKWVQTKKNLKILVDESKSLSERIKNLKNSENGGKNLGPSTYTVILHMVNPKKYATINTPTIHALDELKLSSKNERKTEEWEYIPKLENMILKLCSEINVDTWKIDWVWEKFLKQQSTTWWIISAGEEPNRKNIWNEFRNSNTVGFYWNETGDLRKLNDDQIKEKFDEFDKDWGPGRDILKIKKNDVLFVKHGKRGFYGIGKAIDAYEYNTNQSYHHTIPVEWITTKPYDTPGGIHLSLQLNNTLSRIPDKNQEPRIKKYYDMAKNGTIEDLGEDISNEHMGSSYAELLEDKKQVIFFGPPGTGKTRAGGILAKSFIEKNRLSARDFEMVGINKIAQKSEVNSLSDDKYQEYVLEKIKEEAKNAGFSFTQENNSEHLYSLKKNDDEIRIGVNFSSSSKQNPTDVYLGVPTKMVDFLSGVPSYNRYQLIINCSVKNYILLPFEIEQKFARFVAGTESGKWDSTGKEQHAFHVTIKNDTAELPVRDGTHDLKYYDCEKFTRNIKMMFGDFIRNITFHPSYSYEEFVEGIRPKLNTGNISYDMQDGIFKSIANDARNDPNNKYVLFIDEINRGNISKIFGELITLIENDKREIHHSTLTYTKESFTVPKNLYIIGTMNTADKSLSLLDVALRRRFGFIELMPVYSVINEEIEVDNEKFKLNELLVDLNKKIKKGIGRERQIGHSYFMKFGIPIKTGKQLQSAFVNEIVPLLQEYLYEDNESLLEILGEGFVNKKELELEEKWIGKLEDFKHALKKIPKLPLDNG